MSLLGSIFGGIKGAIGGILTGNPLAAVGGALTGSGIIKTSRAPVIQTAATPTPVLRMPVQTPTYTPYRPPPMLPQAPQGTGIAVGSHGISIGHFPAPPRPPAGPGLSPGPTWHPPMALPGAPPGAPPGGRACGYHPNKSGYFLKNGQYVAPRSKWVRNRRRNPLNPRALSRAMGRLSSAKRAAKALDRFEIKGRRR